MSTPFKVGDPIEGFGFMVNKIRNCMFGVVKTPGEMMFVATGSDQLTVCHFVEWADGTTRSCAAYNLRRRRPPSDSHERTYIQLWRDMAGKAPQRQGEPA
jgi:hypothetical protein